MKETSAVLQEWAKAKRLHELSDAQVQLARELRMNPKRLHDRAGGAKGATNVPLSQLIEDLYLKRLKKALPDAVVPLRQLLRETRARERAEAKERRRKRQAGIDHAEAGRISPLNLRHFLPGGRFYDDALTNKPTNKKQ